MSTQAYYKDRLGFDPAEALNDGLGYEKTQQGYEENLSKFKVGSDGDCSSLVERNLQDTSAASLVAEVGYGDDRYVKVD
ncbi:hypothetical protein R5R35_006899 [Gryllus longicercus]|uniref:Uncharacterized protein n=1 Tax=Gryllus longicercus TaxID=2509291 RepID=A0AAN9VKM9_9ORTH